MLNVLRYRLRLFRYRIKLSSPSTFESFSLVLAIIGIWQVLYNLVILLPLETSPGKLASGLSVVAIIATVWIRFAHYPQNVFSVASRSEKRAEKLSKDLRFGMACDVAYANLYEMYRRAAADLRSLDPGRQVWVPKDLDGSHTLSIAVAAKTGENLEGLLRFDGSERHESWTDRTSRFAAERQQYMNTIRRMSTTANSFGDEEGSNLILSVLDFAPALRMRVNLASYGQIVRTSDALVHEFALFGYLCAGGGVRRSKSLRLSHKSVLAVMPWRREVHRWDAPTAQALIRPSGRAAGIGVSVALLTGDPENKESVVARRSSRVGTYPDMLHVVPSGMMGSLRLATGKNRERQSSEIPSTVMLMEFLEECFDVQELAGQPIANVRKFVDRELAVRGLDDLVPRFTGIAIDLLNLRTEVCATLDLTAHPASVDDLVLCWEYANHTELMRASTESGSRTFRRAEFVQSGLACLDLARSRDA